jgi:hypothetical protein
MGENVRLSRLLSSGRFAIGKVARVKDVGKAMLEAFPALRKLTKLKVGKDLPLILQFYPRPRMRGDWSPIPAGSCRTCFDPRPRMRGDRATSARTGRSLSFDPRPRMRGDPTEQICPDSAGPFIVSILLALLFSLLVRRLTPDVIVGN